LSRADVIVAVSQFLAGEVRLLYGTDRPIDVIHNGWPAAPGSGNLARDRRHGQTTVVAGRVWDAGKNISLVAEAARGWQPGNVLLAGEQRHPESGGRASVPPPLEPLGFLSRKQLDALLRRASVYVSPARYDPFGLLPLQAAINGCALLLSDIPSYRELWSDAALFFDLDDAGDLRRQWRRALEHPEELDSLRASACTRARTSYSSRTMADAYARVYAHVANRVAA
jgi:glycosyltransferase involved in cell wall biosynthesis